MKILRYSTAEGHLQYHSVFRDKLPAIYTTVTEECCSKEITLPVMTGSINYSLEYPIGSPLWLARRKQPAQGWMHYQILANTVWEICERARRKKEAQQVSYFMLA